MIRLANPSKAHRIQMRIFGAICAVSAVWLFAIYRADLGAYNHGKADLYIVWYALAFLVVALGLLTAKLWAEMVFNICLLLLTLATAISLLTNDRQQDSLVALDLAFFVFFLTPVALTIYQFKRGAYFIRGD